MRSTLALFSPTLGLFWLYFHSILDLFEVYFSPQNGLIGALLVRFEVYSEAENRSTIDLKIDLKNTSK